MKLSFNNSLNAGLHGRAFDYSGLSARQRQLDHMDRVNEKVVERLRSADIEVRAQLRQDWRGSIGAPYYFNTRGPDKGLYAVGGLFLGPETLPLLPLDDAALRGVLAETTGGGQAFEVAKGVQRPEMSTFVALPEPTQGPAPALAGAAPVTAAPASATAEVGGNADFIA